MRHGKAAPTSPPPLAAPLCTSILRSNITQAYRGAACWMILSVKSLLWQRRWCWPVETQGWGSNIQRQLLQLKLQHDRVVAWNHTVGHQDDHILDAGRGKRSVWEQVEDKSLAGNRRVQQVQRCASGVFLVWVTLNKVGALVLDHTSSTTA